jgi:putative phosphoribosyl transferase
MLVTPLFQNRVQAGQVLARKLRSFVFDAGTLVLALPRGGVPVAFQIARGLPADLDIVVVRKIGVPGQDELAMGAIASGGTRVLNKSVIAYFGVPPAEVWQATATQQKEIERQECLYRNGRPALPIQGRTVILVDDGLATGASMLAAAQDVQAKRPRRVVVAVPVASREACDEFRRHVDDVICAATPKPFYSVGVWYRDFSQTPDAEVCELLGLASHQHVRSGDP